MPARRPQLCHRPLRRRGWRRHQPAPRAPPAAVPAASRGWAVLPGPPGRRPRPRGTAPVCRAKGAAGPGVSSARLAAPAGHRGQGLQPDRPGAPGRSASCPRAHRPTLLPLGRSQVEGDAAVQLRLGRVALGLYGGRGVCILQRQGRQLAGIGRVDGAALALGGRQRRRRGGAGASDAAKRVSVLPNALGAWPRKQVVAPPTCAAGMLRSSRLRSANAADRSSSSAARRCRSRALPLATRALRRSRALYSLMAFSICG